MLEVTSPSLRPESYDIEVKTATDILLLKISRAGKIQDAYNINNGKMNQKIGDNFYPEMWYLGYNAGFYNDGYYIFGVQAFGYQTFY